MVTNPLIWLCCTDTTNSQTYSTLYSKTVSSVDCKCYVQNLHAALTSLKDYFPSFNVTETGTGTGNRRICLLYISIKFSHYSGSRTGNRTATNILSSHFCTFPDPLEGTLYSILSVSYPCSWSQPHPRCQFENFGIKLVLVPLRLKFWLKKP